MTPDQITLPVRPGQYLVAHLHLARVWNRKMPEELSWFLQSMRGELPPRRQVKNYTIHHVFIREKDRYLAALAAISARMGVRT